MEPGSPYLVGRDGNPDDTYVTAMADAGTGTIDLAVRGRWGHKVWLQSYETLAKCVAGHPDGIVIDLHHLQDRRGVSAPLWLTTRAQGARMQPPVPVVVTAPATTALAVRLTRRGARRRVPVLPTLREAQAALAARDPADQLRLRLPPDATATVVAREAVTDACLRWNPVDLLLPAQLVISELVANAAEHAGTPIGVHISRLGTAVRTFGLRLAVYDQDPRMPRHPARGISAPPGQRGLGLRIVDAAAQAWGALPTRTGKVVWASLRPPHRH